MAGTLYLLPCWLGDSSWPEVIPLGTRNIACNLQYFIVENAKTARAALKWLNHPLPLRDLHIEQLPETSNQSDISRLLEPLTKGQDAGIMSEAGCPGVADPGALVVRYAHLKNITVRPLVGPSSLLLALMASGLDGQQFAFHGYLPPREPERCQRILALEKESRQKQQTQLFIETPYRNRAMFDALLASLHPDTLLCVACDLTLCSESVHTHRVSDWRNYPAPEIDRRPTVFLLLSVR